MYYETTESFEAEQTQQILYIRQKYIAKDKKVIRKRTVDKEKKTVHVYSLQGRAYGKFKPF